jgi:hypothetical protein
MPTIQCSAALWRFVRLWRGAREKPPRIDSPRLTLGPWAATIVHDGSRDLVVSVEAHTYFTVVCALTGETAFPPAWRRALAFALEDVRVAPEQIAIEAAAPAHLRVERLTDPAMREVLKTVDFVCETELCYHTDLRVIQRNLNEFPHDNPPDYVPLVAVRRLLGARPAT